MPRAALIALSAGLVLASPVSAQWTDRREPAVVGAPAIPLTEGRFNAALQYHASWMLLEPVLEYADFSPEQLDAMDTGVLPEAYAGALENSRDEIAMLIAATGLKTCDFGLQYEQGIGMLIPQLAVMRNSAKLLVNDARRLKGSDMDAVAERLAATIRMGEHATQMNVIIGSLVGVAIIELARVETQRLIDAGTLNEAQAGVINGALDRVLTDDPFHATAALRSEATSLPAWVKEEFDDRDAGLRLAKLLDSAVGDGGQERALNDIRRMTGEEVAATTDELSGAYQELLAAWGAEDPFAAMSVVEARVQKGEFGVLSRLLLPSVQRYRQSTLDAEGKLRGLRESLLRAAKG